MASLDNILLGKRYFKTKLCIKNNYMGRENEIQLKLDRKTKKSAMYRKRYEKQQNFR